MDWYKNHFKIFTIASVTLLSLTGGSLYYGQSNYAKMSQTQTLQGGLGTCFTRVTQSFTSLMIGQGSSVYLRPQFVSTTGDCFSEVNKLFKASMANFKGATKTLNKLVSDTHWFHEKVRKIKSMNTTDRVGGFSNSNIIDKYVELEKSKDNLITFLDNRYAASKKVADASTWGAVAFFFAMIGFGAYYLVSRVKVVRELDDIEKRAEKILGEPDTHETEKLISSALKLSNMGKTRQLFLEFRGGILLPQANEKVDVSFVETLTENNDNASNENENTHEQNNVSGCFSVALGSIQTKAFNHGVIVDFDLDDELTVKGEGDTFQQLLYNVLDYSIEASIKHNQGRKVTVRTKGLGGTALVKFRINGHCMNSSELDFFTNYKISQEQVSLNLTLVKEFIQDLGAEISIKNRFNGDGETVASEIEITLARGTDAEAEVSTEAELSEGIDVDTIPPEIQASEEESARLVSVVKGKKRDLLRRMNSEV